MPTTPGSPSTAAPTKSHHRVLSAPQSAPSRLERPTTDQVQPVPTFGDLLTTNEVATTLRVNVRTVRELVTRRQLEGYRVGKEYRIPRAALAAYLEAVRP